jgi:hypothetical protein
VPGKEFSCKKVLDKETPVSPLLLVLATDCHKVSSTKATPMASFGLPLPNRDTNHFLIIPYADDTLLFMQADTRQLLRLKALFRVLKIQLVLK